MKSDTTSTIVYKIYLKLFPSFYNVGRLVFSSLTQLKRVANILAYLTLHHFYIFSSVSQESALFPPRTFYSLDHFSTDKKSRRKKK